MALRSDERKCEMSCFRQPDTLAAKKRPEEYPLLCKRGSQLLTEGFWI